MSIFKKIFKQSSKTDLRESPSDAFFTINKDKIYPWVKLQLADNEENPNEHVLELKGDENPIYRQWLGNLIIMYVFDTGSSFQIILQRDLPKSINENELHSIAISNLNRDIEFKLMDTTFGGHMLTAGGDHEAGAICLPEIWSWLAGQLNDSIIVAIPAKDLVLFVPKSDNDKINNLEIFVHEIFNDGERLLTRNLFEYNKDTAEWSIVDNANQNATNS